LNKKSRKGTKDFIDISFSLIVLIGIYIGFKTGNYKIGIGIVVIGAIVISGIIKLANYSKMKRLISTGITIVDKMSGEDFEKFLLAHFNNLGYKGTTTAKTGDFGADLVLNKENVRIVVQAKRWEKKVGVEAIQQIVAAIKYYNANMGIVITNSYFTKNAFELARANGIELWDRTKLQEVMNNSNGKELANKVISKTYSLLEHDSSQEAEKVQVCPNCQGKLVLRQGKNGSFYGCANYPKCRYTKNIL
jgi:restriction system protein